MNKLVVALAVALLGAGIGTVQLWQQLDDLRVRKDQLQARVVALESAPPGLAARQLQQPRSQQHQEASSTSNAQPPDPGEATPAPSVSDDERARLRASIADSHDPDLGPEVGLSPAEVEHFYDLLVDLRAAQGAGGSQQQIRAARSAINALLGARAPKWREYQQTEGARLEVNELRGELAANGLALSDAQSRSLIAALHAERTAFLKEWPGIRGPSAPTARERMKQIQQYNVLANRRLLEVVRPLLDSRQLAVYKKLLDAREQSSRVMFNGG